MRLFIIFVVLFLLGCSSAAAKPSVYVLVFDELPGQMLMDKNGNLYKERFPNLGKIAEQATYYPNNTTVSDTTFSAIPAILTGEVPEGESPNFNKSRSLFTLLKKTHRVLGYEAVTSVCEQPHCTPTNVGEANLIGSMRIGVVPPDLDWWGLATNQAVRRMAWMIKHAGGPGPELWFTHAMIPHVPWRFLPNGDQYFSPPEFRYPGVDAEGHWGSSEEMAALSQQRAMLQMQFADRVVGVLRRKLEKAGRWDSSMVVITADHGESFTPNTTRRSVEDENFSEVANTPLLVKYPGQGQGRVDSSATRSVDILPTVARETGTGQDWSFEGTPLDQAPAERPIAVRDAADDGKMLTHSFQFFLESRSRSLALQSSRFPAAQPVASPGVAAQYARSSRAAGSYTLDAPQYLKRVRPGSGWNAAAFTIGRASVSGRLLAVLNNKPATITRTFDGGRFGVMLPGLKRGSNKLALYIQDGKRWRRLVRR